MRYTQMNARFGGFCAQQGCDATIEAGDAIYYSREAGGAFCLSCGQAKFEPKKFVPQPPKSSGATLSTVMPYTFTRGCYCALVGAPCGWCVAEEALKEEMDALKESVATVGQATVTA